MFTHFDLLFYIYYCIFVYIVRLYNAIDVLLNYVLCYRIYFLLCWTVISTSYISYNIWLYWKYTCHASLVDLQCY